MKCVINSQSECYLWQQYILFHPGLTLHDRLGMHFKRKKKAINVLFAKLHVKLYILQVPLITCPMTQSRNSSAWLIILFILVKDKLLFWKIETKNPTWKNHNTIVKKPPTSWKILANFVRMLHNITGQHSPSTVHGYCEQKKMK